MGGEGACMSSVAAQGGTVEMGVLVQISLPGVFGVLSSCPKLSLCVWQSSGMYQAVVVL